ncbi:uncharacterized protein LOC124115802 [Haliotis rufescens]|uniref:uncharacterized protein LOC124115802 n=1 Tax=Haliotis rufescens TaxID=6454 RepID=UPI001EAFE4E4|nr:uncharacterized protein LOC124115802 [Haliotis rufescens]
MPASEQLSKNQSVIQRARLARGYLTRLNMDVLRGVKLEYVLLCLFALEGVLVNGLSLETDLSVLSELLPGVYSNSKQYVAEAGARPAKGHMLMKTVIRPVDVPFLGHSFNVFVEQYSGADSVPYRQRLESFSVDDAQRAIRLRTFNFANASMIPRFSSDLKLLRNLSVSDVVTQKGCDMFWRKLKKRTFVGATGRGCLGSVRREPVRISVSTTLTSKMLTTHEGWYRVKDGTKVMEIEVPFNLIKVKRISGARYIPRAVSPRVRMSRHLIQNDLPQDRPNYMRRKNPKFSLKPRKQRTYLSSIPTSNSAWTLRTFRSLLDALGSGRAVYFIMELSRCMLPSQAKIERTSFGDAIDVFEHVKQMQGRRREFIKFSQRKFQQSARGYETAVREITVFRNGKVIVRLRMTKPDKVPVTYAASCRLYDYDASSGDVKFSTDPFKNVRRIKTFGFLRSSLKKGRRVRMTVDFSKCSGNSPNTMTEIGGEIRGYDFINSGKGIEFSLARPELDLSRDGVSQRFLLGRVLHNGDVIFTDIGDEHSNSFHQNEHHFKCSLRGSESVEKPGEKSVKMYYL